MTSTTDMPTPREIIIETMAMEVEEAHEKHVVAYSINRVKTYGWKLPAGSTGQESEPESMAACIQASDAFDELLRKQLQEAFDYGQAAGQANAGQCLHQIQEPPTKTEALAHYSQQAILAMGEAGAAAPVQAAVDSPMAVTLNALLQSEAALEVAMARILKADPGHSISVTSEAKALVAVRAALFAQAMPAAVAVPDEREAFEKWARFFGTWDLERDDDPSFSTTGYKDMTVTVAWMAWQARPALAATPAAAAAVMLPEAVAWRHSRTYDLHETEDEVQLADGDEHAQPLFTEPQVRALLAQQLAIMPKGESAAAQLRAMATNYPSGHSWDKLDAKACIRGALEIEALRALQAGVSAPAAQAVPDWWVQVVRSAHKLAKARAFDLPDSDHKKDMWEGQSEELGKLLDALIANAPQSQTDARDAAFEAVRKRFCKLQRYSFFLDDKGNVRRTPDYCGNWVEFETVHTLFEPAAVDAAIAAQAAQQGGE